MVVCRNCPDLYGGIATLSTCRRERMFQDAVGTALICMVGLRPMHSASQALPAARVGTALICMVGLRLPGVNAAGIATVVVGTALICMVGLRLSSEIIP
jgi:hypothetical protein